MTNNCPFINNNRWKLKWFIAVLWWSSRVSRALREREKERENEGVSNACMCERSLKSVFNFHGPRERLNRQWAIAPPTRCIMGWLTGDWWIGSSWPVDQDTLPPPPPSRPTVHPPHPAWAPPRQSPHSNEVKLLYWFKINEEEGEPVTVMVAECSRTLEGLLSCLWDSDSTICASFYWGHHFINFCVIIFQNSFHHVARVLTCFYHVTILGEVSF